MYLEKMRNQEVTLLPTDIKLKFDYENETHITLTPGGEEKMRSLFNEPTGDFRYLIIEK